MIHKLRIDVFKFHLNFIFALIWLKLMFSYLSVELSYFQRHLVSNADSFNYLNFPIDFSNKIEFVLLPALFFFVLKYYRFAGVSREFIGLSFLMFLSSIATGFFNKVSLFDSLIYSFKIFTPIYLFCSLIIYHNRTGNNLKKYLIVTIKICLILSVVALIFFNPSFNRLTSYLPVFFGGIHTHNYILSSVFIAIGFLLYKQKKNYSLIAFLLLSFLFLYIGYNVRTALIMYLIFIIIILSLLSDLFKILFIKILIFTPLIIVFFLLLFDIDNLSDFSSGRTTMYFEKLKILKTYNIFELIFGRGYGSDLISTDVWWWSKKGSHSDIITFIIENGLIYLFFFSLLIFKFFTLDRKPNIIFIGVVLGVLISSIISNGVLVRPTAGYVIFTVLAYIYVNSKRIEKAIIKNE